MVKVVMITLKLHPSEKKSAHFKTVANAEQWLNLNSFDSFSAYVHCATGKTHRHTFRKAEELSPWVRGL
jgi:hypothetical protein